jgi:hypothetical protein
MPVEQLQAAQDARKADADAAAKQLQLVQEALDKANVSNEQHKAKLEEKFAPIKGLKEEMSAMKASHAESTAELKKDLADMRRQRDKVTRNRDAIRGELGNEVLDKHIELRNAVESKQKVERETQTLKAKLQLDEQQLSSREAFFETLQEGTDSEERKLVLRNQMRAELEAHAAVKVNKVAEELALCKNHLEEQKALNEKVHMFIGEMACNAQGVKEFHTTFEASRPAKESSAAARFTDIQAAQIYKEGRNTGYLESHKESELAFAMAYPEKCPDFKRTPAHDYVTNVQNPLHRYNRGMEVGHSIVGAIVAQQTQLRELDLRVWKSANVTLDMMQPRNLTDPPKEGFWDGVRTGAHKRIKEYEPQVKAWQEEQKTMKKASNNA